MARINITEVDVGGPEAEALVLDVLRSGRLAQGPMVERLESGFAEICGAKHVVAVNNGTTALVAAIEAAGIGPGDEVITSPFTFVATLNAILEAGATARFADIGPDFNIDPDAIEALINERTRALIPVHLYGQCADMASIMEIAARHDLIVIEDAAQAHGATFGGQPAGSFGIGCFSLYATKNMTTGEGGFVTTNDDAIADRLRILRNQGMRARYQYEVAGHNWRMTDLQAAVGIPQLATLEAKTVARRKNAASLNEHLDDIGGLMLPCTFEGREHVWHQYTVRVLPDASATRDELNAHLSECDIFSGVYYPKVVYDYECYAEHPQVVHDPAPMTEAVVNEALSLPVHPKLSDADLAEIAGAVRTLLRPDRS